MGGGAGYRFMANYSRKNHDTRSHCLKERSGKAEQTSAYLDTLMA